MVRATDRHTSRLYRYGCRDGATPAQFWSLNDKTIVRAILGSSGSQEISFFGTTGPAGADLSPRLGSMRMKYEVYKLVATFAGVMILLLAVAALTH
jgi:hypothetical protein